MPRSVLKSLQQNTFCDLKCWQIINVKDKLDLFFILQKAEAHSLPAEFILHQSEQN